MIIPIAVSDTKPLKKYLTVKKLKKIYSKSVKRSSKINYFKHLPLFKEWENTFYKFLLLVQKLIPKLLSRSSLPSVMIQMPSL